MTELQYAGLVTFLIGALPCYYLAHYIEKGKHYSLFAGWNPSKITDEDAYAKLLCKGVKSFSLVMGVGCLLVFLNLIGPILFAVSIILLPIFPLGYYIIKAKKCYGQ